MGSCVLKALVSLLLVNIKQLLDEVFVISRIIKVEVRGYQKKKIVMTVSGNNFLIINV